MSSYDSYGTFYNLVMVNKIMPWFILIFIETSKSLHYIFQHSPLIVMKTGMLHHVTLKPLKGGRANGFGSSRSLNNRFCGLGRKSGFGTKLRKPEMIFFKKKILQRINRIRAGAAYVPGSAYFLKAQ